MSNKDIGDIYRGMRSGKKYEQPTREQDLYSKVLEEAIVTVTSNDNIKHKVEVDDNVAGYVLKYIKTADLSKNFREYAVVKKGYKPNDTAAFESLEGIIRFSDISDTLSKVFKKFTASNKGLPALKPYSQHGNEFSLLSTGGKRYLFDKLALQHKIEPGDMDDLVVKLINNQMMPARGQSTGNGEVLFLLLFGDTVSPDKSDIEIAGGHTLEVKEGDARVGSGADFAVQAPGKYKQLVEGVLGADIDAFNTRIQQQLKDNIAGAEMLIDLSRSYQEEALTAEDLIYHSANHPFGKRGSCSTMVSVNEHEAENIFRDIVQVAFSSNELLPFPGTGTKLKAAISGGVIKFQTIINIVNERYPKMAQEIISALQEDILNGKCELKRVVINSKILKQAEKSIDDNNRRLEHINVGEVKYGGTYREHMNAFFNILKEYKDKNAIKPAEYKQLLAEGLYLMRNFTTLDDGGLIANECKKLANTLDIDFLIENIAKFCGSIQAMCYQIEEGFDSILFMNRKTYNCIVVDTKSVSTSGSKIMGMVNFMIEKGLDADQAIDSSRKDGVHVWYNG